jgi:hypothetical protein
MVQKLACHAKFRVVILIFPLTIGCLVVGVARKLSALDF